MTKKKERVCGYILIKNSRYIIREKPDAHARPMMACPANGEKVSYLGVSKKKWHKVSVNGTVGWLFAQAGALFQVEQKCLTVKKGKWHVRSAPNGKAVSLGTVKGGDKILDQGESKDNYRLVMFENQNGWLPNRAIEKE